jgi:hypothetical protein
MIHRRNALPALLLLAVVVSGCGRPTVFIDPETDFPYYETVAVLPFTSLAGDRLAGEKVTAVFVTELLEKNMALVMEPGQFMAAMTQIRGSNPMARPWSTADLARLGEEAGVQGIFMGTVNEYAMVSSGRDQFPTITLEVRFVDAATGRVIWSASKTRRGGPAFPIFGWGEVRTLGELTSMICEDLLSTLPGGRS